MARDDLSEYPGVVALVVLEAVLVDGVEVYHHLQINIVFVAVLRIRIRKDPFHFGQPDPDPLQ